MKDMDRKTKLKLFSYLLIALATMDIVFMLIVCFFVQDAMLRGTSIVVDAKIVVLSAVILYGIEILLNLFLAVRGLRQAHGATFGSAHIVLSTILFVISLLGVVCCIYDIVTSGTMANSMIVSSVIETIVYFGYRKSAKAVKRMQARRNKVSE